MTNLVLENPREDTLPTTLSKTDPMYEVIPNIAAAHWGTWLSVGVSVLGFEDTNFPPHNVRYDTIYTPIDEDIKRAEEFYPGGHDTPVPSEAARDALRAQSYQIGCRPPTSTGALMVAPGFLAISCVYEDTIILCTGIGTDFSEFDLRIRGDNGFDYTENVIITSIGAQLGQPVTLSSIGAPFGVLHITTRLVSADGVESDWSPVTAQEYRP